VFALLNSYATDVELFAPDTAFQEARQHLPTILSKRGLAATPAIKMLDSLAGVIRTIELETYEPFEAAARGRLKHRDEDDWPVLACALALGCPIWTEDADFFGCGVATWTTDRVELYFNDAAGRDR
jgi:predicted nucleic acid-binding protein